MILTNEKLILILHLLFFFYIYWLLGVLYDPKDFGYVLLFGIVKKVQES